MILGLTNRKGLAVSDATRPSRNRLGYQRPPAGSLPSGWDCVVCGVYVKRTKGPVGMYCAEHKNSADRRQLRQQQCAECGSDFRARYKQKYCSDECRSAVASRRERPERPTPRTNLRWRQCLHCTKWMCKPDIRTTCSAECAKAKRSPGLICPRCKGSRPSFKTFCDKCRSAKKRAIKRAVGNDRARARYFGVKYELVHRPKVYERDNWMCGICGTKVDKRLKHPHPRAASLDHIVPISLGGGHLYVNVQCAHWDCNVAKSNTGAGEQLALIG